MLFLREHLESWTGRKIPRWHLLAGGLPGPVAAGQGLSWNEQYFLQAFLMHNEAWRTRLAVFLLRTLHPHLFAEFTNPRWSYDGGASVWLEKV